MGRFRHLARILDVGFAVTFPAVLSAQDSAQSAIDIRSNRL
jgi:hypothetical protein